MVILSALDSFNNFISNFGTLHPWTLFKRHYVRLNFYIVFQVFIKFTQFVSIEEVCNVTVLLGFGNSQQTDTALCKILTHSSVDTGGADQELSGNMQITVVLHHSGIFYSGYTFPVKMREIAVSRGFKSIGHFQSSVTSEIEINNTVTVIDGTYRFTVFNNNKLVHVLVQNTGNFGSVSFNSLCS